MASFFICFSFTRPCKYSGATSPQQSPTLYSIILHEFFDQDAVFSYKDPSQTDDTCQNRLLSLSKTLKIYHKHQQTRPSKMAYRNGRFIGLLSTGTRPPTEFEKDVWRGTKPIWNWAQTPDLMARHIFEANDPAFITKWTGRGVQSTSGHINLGRLVAARHKEENLSSLALGGTKDKWIIMTIFRNLLAELANLGEFFPLSVEESSCLRHAYTKIVRSHRNHWTHDSIWSSWNIN